MPQGDGSRHLRETVVNPQTTTPTDSEVVLNVYDPRDTALRTALSLVLATGDPLGAGDVEKIRTAVEEHYNGFLKLLCVPTELPVDITERLDRIEALLAGLQVEAPVIIPAAQDAPPTSIVSTDGATPITHLTPIPSGSVSTSPEVAAQFTTTNTDSAPAAPVVSPDLPVSDTDTTQQEG